MKIKKIAVSFLAAAMAFSAAAGSAVTTSANILVPSENPEPGLNSTSAGWYIQLFNRAQKIEYDIDYSKVAKYSLTFTVAEEVRELWEQGTAKSTFARILEVCFLLRSAEKQIVLNPYALCRMISTDYKEELSAADRQNLMAAYQEQIAAGDPFYNKNLSLERHWQRKQ